MNASAQVAGTSTVIYAGQLTLFFSYSTLVGIAHPALAKRPDGQGGTLPGTVISENIGGSTTGHHIRSIPGAAILPRTPRAEFERIVGEVLDAASDGIERGVALHGVGGAL